MFILVQLKLFVLFIFRNIKYDQYKLLQITFLKRQFYILHVTKFHKWIAFLTDS